MKTLSRIFTALALVLSHAMCAVVAYNYCELAWGGRYAGFSAPPDTAFVCAIPFLIGIALCALLAAFMHRKGLHQAAQNRVNSATKADKYAH